MPGYTKRLIALAVAVLPFATPAQAASVGEFGTITAVERTSADAPEIGLVGRRLFLDYAVDGEFGWDSFDAGGAYYAFANGIGRVGIDRLFATSRDGAMRLSGSAAIDFPDGYARMPRTTFDGRIDLDVGGDALAIVAGSPLADLFGADIDIGMSLLARTSRREYTPAGSVALAAAMGGTDPKSLSLTITGSLASATYALGFDRTSGDAQQVLPTPLPAAASLLAVGIAALGLAVRRRRRAVA